MHKIGLASAKGTGTSGYLVRNYAAERRRKHNKQTAKQKPVLKDPYIVMHEKKREIEVKCLQLRLELEEQGLADDDIDMAVDALRNELLDQMQAAAMTSSEGLPPLPQPPTLDGGPRKAEGSDSDDSSL
eukprot:Clim_evm20s164 gene=Clim_evmTU20s164